MLQVYTEQYGVQKFGILWMDYVYSMAKPDSRDGTTSRFHFRIFNIVFCFMLALTYFSSISQEFSDRYKEASLTNFGCQYGKMRDQNA